MDGVLLAELAVVIPAHTIDLGLLLIRTLGVTLLCHHDRVIVTARDIEHLLIPNGIHQGRC